MATKSNCGSRRQGIELLASAAKLQRQRLSQPEHCSQARADAGFARPLQHWPWLVVELRGRFLAFLDLCVKSLSDLVT